MKKIYNNPQTEIVEVQGGYMMLDPVSEGSGIPPVPHMPAKGGVI